MSSTQPVIIRDAIYSRIVGMSGRWNLVRRAPMPTLQATELPAVSVFVLAEDENSDGEPNIGHLKYLEDCSIGISVARAFNDPLFLEGQLDQDVLDIKNLLLTDATFTNRSPERALFESIPRIRRTWVFEPGAEAYMGELRLEMTFRFREAFLPVIVDDFRTMDVKVISKHGTVEAEVVYTLNQGSGHSS